MSYLQHFNLQSSIFENVGENSNYMSKSQKFIIDNFLDEIRNTNGIYKITGKKGSGKTFLIQKIQKILNITDKCLYFRASERYINLEYILHSSSIKFNEKGQLSFSKVNDMCQTVIVIDDAENLSLKDYEFLNTIYSWKIDSKISFVLCGNNKINEILFKNSMDNIIDNTIDYYIIRPFSFLQSLIYIKKNQKSSRSFGKTEKALSIASTFLIAFVSNGSINLMNSLVKTSLMNAYKNNQKKAKILDVFKAMQKSPDYVYKNILKNIFYYLVVLLFCIIAFRTWNFSMKYYSRSFLAEQIENRIQEKEESKKESMKEQMNKNPVYKIRKANTTQHEKSSKQKSSGWFW